MSAFSKGPDAAAASTVSLCMIVKNEESRLAACVASARAAVHEIIVVDTGSTDHTLAVASELGAKVSSFDFTKPDFAGARNQSLAHASSDWILVLDADECLTETAPEIIRALTNTVDPMGYVVSRRNRPSPQAAPSIDYAVRFFANRPQHRYRGRVHETIDAAILENGGRIRTSHLTIEHAPPRDGDDLRRKGLFYLGILDEELAASPHDTDRLNFRRAELHKLGRMEEAAGAAERIAELAPDDPTNHFHVGLYRMHAGDGAGAERAFRRALALQPDHPEALNALRALVRT